jgi:hypothetical protein
MPLITSKGREISPAVADELQTQRLRIMPIASAERLWERVLTAEDRQRLGGDLALCYTRLRGTAGIWMELRGVSYERAIIEVARGLGFLRDRNAEWLLREIREEPAPPTDPSCPIWDPGKGELRLGGGVIRKVRVMAQPTNVQRILNAFQAAGWPSRIDDPLSGRLDQQRLHQAVISLNKGLAAIRFHVQEGGQAVTWGRA